MKAEERFAQNRRTRLFSKTSYDLNQETNELIELFKQLKQRDCLVESRERLTQKIERLLATLQKIKNLPDSESLEVVLDKLISTLAPGDMLKVALDSIAPYPDQPRQTFTQESIVLLARSLEREGQKMPVILVQKEERKYLIYDGERRWRAAQFLQWKSLEALVIPNPQNLHRQILVTNLQRENLNPLDKAEGIVREIQSIHPELNIKEIIAATRAAVRRLERDKNNSGKLSQLIQLEEQQRQIKLESLKLKEQERHIFQILLSLQLNPESILKNTFPALEISSDLKEAIRKKGLGASQALELNKISPNNKKLQNLEEEQVAKMRRELSTSVITEKLSVRATRQLVNEKLASYSHNNSKNQTRNEFNKTIATIKNIALDNLELSQLEQLQMQLEELQKTLEEKMSSLSPTWQQKKS